MDYSSPTTAHEILRRYRTWAVVGASPSPARASHGVMRTLMRHGYDVIGVNPFTPEACGVTCYPNLAAAAEEHDIEVVDIFRRSEFAGAHVDEAIAIGAKAVWMQLGVIDEAAARRAQEAGLLVVIDRCPAIDLPGLDPATLPGARAG
jgi:predicted CoA-binding protein